MGLNKLRKIFDKFKKSPFEFSIKHPFYDSNPYDNEIYHETWTNYDDFLLIRGIMIHGIFLFFNERLRSN